MTRFPAGDDPILATVFGTRSKSLGALLVPSRRRLLIRGVGVAFICRARAKAVAAAHARNLEAWPTCLVRTAELGDCEESSTLAWAWH
jgi:hypothetical protein